MSLAAKNEMHNIKGYSPNQWCFGQKKERVQSFLQNGNHLPTVSLRNQSESFEAAIRRADLAHQTFLKADSRRRILRAARGRARKAETFEVGQLVYFYRKGRNNTSKHEAGWHGPARVLAIEKQGDSLHNQTQGSVIWIVHATILYRCAPEQLRKVPGFVQHTHDTLHDVHSPLEELRRAGNQANYRDISQDLSQEAEDSEIHDDEPSETSRGSISTKPPPPHFRITGKRAQDGPEQQGRRDSEPPGHGQGRGQEGSSNHHGPRGSSLPSHGPGNARPGEGDQWQVRRDDVSTGSRPSVQVPDVADPASRGQQQVSERDHLRQADGDNDGTGGARSGVQPSDAADFWRTADQRRHEQNRSRGSSSRDGRRSDAHRDGEDVRGQPDDDRGPPVPGSAAGSLQRGSPDRHVPDARSGAPATGAGGDPKPTPSCSRGRDAPRDQVRRERSRTPAGLRDVQDLNLWVDKQESGDKQACWSNWVDRWDEDQDDVLLVVPEEDVGNLLDLSHGGLGCRGDKSFELSSMKLGCFGDGLIAGTWEAVPKQPALGVTRDYESYFSHAAQEQCQVLEITMDLQARDVHQTKVGGQNQWVLNEKPKKRAEVQFKSLSDAEKLDFMKAMRNELSSYLEHEAIQIASRHNVPRERILGMRWVLTWKAITNEETGVVSGQKPKARLIIKGFQDPDLLKLKRDSPTLSTQSRNMVLGLAACHGWQCYVGDIKTAFLNGDQTEAARQIYAEPPEEVKLMLGLKPHELFRIMKAVYGLLHAPRAWSDKLGKELAKQGWVQSKLEPCVWRLYEDGVLCGLIGIHVDDLLCCGSGSWFQQQIQVLRQSFPFGSWKDLMHETVTFCGCELRQRPDGTIELNQERYAEAIPEIPLSRERRAQTQDALTEAEKKRLRTALGALSWRATQSAPWISASTSYLQGCYKESVVDDILQVNKLIRLQKQYSQVNVEFSSKIREPVVLTFRDASWACRRDGTSQGGVITLFADRSVLEGQPGVFAPIAWQSRKLPRVCRSSTAAEVQAGSHADDSHEFTKQMIVEWMNERPIPPKSMDQALSMFPSIVVTDSKNLCDSVVRIESSGLQLEEKRLALEVLSIRERVAAAGVLYKWVDSDQQLGDPLSKPFIYDSLLLAMQRKQLCLKFDENFISAKRKRAWKRQNAVAATNGASRSTLQEKVSPV